MSGNYRGKVEMWSNSGLFLNNAQALFKGIYDFWSAHPNATMIAINYGAPTLLPAAASTPTVAGSFGVTNGLATVTMAQSISTPVIMPGTVINFSNFPSVSYTVLSISGLTLTLTATFGGATSGSVSASVMPGSNYYDGYGHGLNTYDGYGTGPFGQNAWFVFRLNATLARPFDVYHMFQWFAGSNVASQIIAPGLPGLCVGSINSSSGYPVIIHSAAIGVGGTGGSAVSVADGYGNPWKGSTLLNGIDTKTPTLSGTFSVINGSPTVTASGSPAIVIGNILIFSNYPYTPYTINNIVGSTITLSTNFAGATNGAVTAASMSATIWGPPAGGGTAAYIFPRSNSIGGLFVNQAQNMGIVYFSQNNSNTIAARMDIVADDDSFCIMTDVSDNGIYAASFSGIYTQKPNTVGMPYLVVDSGANNIPFSVVDGTIYGDTAGTNNFQGGIISPVGNVHSLQFDRLPTFMGDTNFHPNLNYTTQEYDSFDINVGINETKYYGFMGQIDWIRETLNIATNSTKSDFSRIVIGGTSVTTIKLSVPWDSQNKTPPRSGSNRAGVTFVNNIA